MELTIAPEKLIEVLKVLDLIPTRPGIPSSVYVSVEEKKGELQMALSSDIAGEVKVKGKGELGLKKPIYVDRRLFFPFVFTAKTYHSDKPFVFSKADKQVLVHQGRRKASFDLIAQSSGYGDLNGANGGLVLPVDEKLSDLMAVACACSTSDPTVPELNCVYLTRDKVGLDLYASNQLVVFKGVQKSKQKFPDRLPFPLFLVPLLQNEGIKEIRLKEKEVILQFNCGYIWQGVSVKAQKNFPMKTIETHLNGGKKWAELFSLQTHRLGAVVKRFSEYLTAIRRQDWLLTVKAEPGDKQVLLEVSIPQGIFREKISVEEPVENAVNVAWPLDQLLVVFAFMAKSKDTILTVRGDKKTPYLLSAGGVELVVARKKA